MRKFLVLASFFALAIPPLVGNEPEGKTVLQDDIEENEFEDALLDFINGKRSIPIADKSKNLCLSAELMFKWENQRERINGHDVKSYTFSELEEWTDEIFVPGDSLKISPNEFEVQLDVFLDWKGEKTWARTQLRYNDSAGVSDNGLDVQIDPIGYHGSGSVDNLNLREAYWGYEIFNCKDNRLTMEIGRRGPLSKVFFSEIEFDSRLDGVILKFASKHGAGIVEDWAIIGAAFVVDWRSDYYAWAIQLDLNNVLGTGLDLKYSYIDWEQWGKNRYFIKHPLGFRFKVSQWSFNYEINPKCFYPVSFAGGFLMNHIPAKYTYINGAVPPKYSPVRKNIGKQNLGGFFTFQVNEIEHEGDWYATALIGYCEAQCIPDEDVRNISTGNLLKQSMTAYGRGYTNWKGYSLSAGYAITDNWVVVTKYDHSWNIVNIAGTHSWREYSLETRYHF